MHGRTRNSRGASTCARSRSRHARPTVTSCASGGPKRATGITGTRHLLFRSARGTFTYRATPYSDARDPVARYRKVASCGARPGSPILAGHCHEIADQGSRHARGTITSRGSHDPEMRDPLSLNCAHANACVFSLCIALRNGDPIGPKVVRGISERDPGDPGTSYGKFRT
jgi:hypothetical protein